MRSYNRKQHDPPEPAVQEIKDLQKNIAKLSDRLDKIFIAVQDIQKKQIEQSEDMRYSSLRAKEINQKQEAQQKEIQGLKQQIGVGAGIILATQFFINMLGGK